MGIPADQVAPQYAGSSPRWGLLSVSCHGDCLYLACGPMEGPGSESPGGVGKQEKDKGG